MQWLQQITCIHVHVSLHQGVKYEKHSMKQIDTMAYGKVRQFVERHELLFCSSILSAHCSGSAVLLTATGYQPISCPDGMCFPVNDNHLHSLHHRLLLHTIDVQVLCVPLMWVSCVHLLQCTQNNILSCKTKYMLHRGDPVSSQSPVSSHPVTVSSHDTKCPAASSHKVLCASIVTRSIYQHKT